jgi:regulator of sirC expression with transglutaminase-like and TPR domain
MSNSKEIAAIISLLDDPDPIIFEQISKKILSLGTTVIPMLESQWELSLDALLQQRIEQLIHQIQYNTVKEELKTWASSGSFDLLSGFITIARLQYPELDEQKLINQIEAIKRDAWIELRYDTSPLEKVKILNHVFYSINGFTGNTTNFHDPQNSYINNVLESRRGNQISLAVIYSIVAQRLDIPIYGVNLPQHFVLAYLDEKQEYPHISSGEANGILFYINAFNKGSVFNRRDVDHFLKQLEIQPESYFYNPCSNIQIIKRILRNLISAYEKQSNIEKASEIEELLTMLLDIEPDKN